ncbi:DUF599 family protein [Heterostelium album PN500]|uniref:DUF599 family protein n=1 Tax=Heterostelium pallidum (strain ATCC 26659 / Pp 5 / PN500) TaxID=670386 RepID=D3BI28_HETP5|nr:DUF599 family protein [Heterostelium album PN500]EFA78928.1 DUF599 family protein [Heterostelium album PN500]|eukprot:XP_020431052.1 DUF599 family protein [Heterostelium album PN500]
MLEGLLYDIIFFCCSIGVFAIYHVQLFLRSKSSTGHLTSIGRNHQHREEWLELMIRGKKDILAVQTLRNLVMAASLLATASITLVVLILNIVVNNNLSAVFDKIRILGANNKEVLIYKAFILILVYLFSFLNFATSIRYSTHLAFLININDCSMRYCNKIMRNASNHYTFGVRSFYFSMVVILWFFDPIFLIVSTVLLVIWLYFGDSSDFVIPIEEKKAARNSATNSTDVEMAAKIN